MKEEKIKMTGAICGGDREATWKWIKEAKTKKEFLKRLEIGFMAIIE